MTISEVACHAPHGLLYYSYMHKRIGPKTPRTTYEPLYIEVEVTISGRPCYPRCMTFDDPRSSFNPIHYIMMESALILFFVKSPKQKHKL